MKQKRAPKTKDIGWAVCNCYGSMDGDWQIQKIDNPHDVDSKYDGYDSAFIGDEEAIVHVIRLAKKGDVEAIDALWEVLPHDGLVNRFFWAEHFPHFGTEYPG